MIQYNYIIQCFYKSCKQDTMLNVWANEVTNDSINLSE